MMKTIIRIVRLSDSGYFTTKNLNARELFSLEVCIEKIMNKKIQVSKASYSSSKLKAVHFNGNTLVHTSQSPSNDSRRHAISQSQGRWHNARHTYSRGSSHYGMRSCDAHLSYRRRRLSVARGLDAGVYRVVADDSIC